MTQAFCVGISLLEYNECCFKLLHDKFNDTDVSQCFIRIEIFHIIITVRNKIFAQ